MKAAARKSKRDTNKAIESFYHDRFLCRIFSEPEPSFILKGGQSQLARKIGARETRDIDLVGTTNALDESLKELKRLAAIDLDDFIDFVFIDSTRIPVSQEYREGYRVEFAPFIGKTKRINSIHIDLVIDTTPTNNYEVCSPANRLEIKGLKTFDYALQIIEERIADKICAIMQNYEGKPSSRVKDLIDLTVSMTSDRVEANLLIESLKRETRLRNIPSIDNFEIPASWHNSAYETTFSKEAQLCEIPTDFRTMVRAEKAIKQWLKPITNKSARNKIWFPTEQVWK